MAKQQLRQHVSKLIESIPLETRISEGAIAVQNLLKSDRYSKSRHVALYSSFGSEIDTSYLIRRTLELGKTCYLPRIDKTNLKFYQIESFDDYQSLKPNNWGILQPEEDANGERAKRRKEVFETGELDLVVTPGLAFDLQGHRLGRGKGYYDKFFNDWKTKYGDVYKVAVALNVQVLDLVPTQQWDVGMDMVFYPQGTIETKA